MSRGAGAALLVGAALGLAAAAPAGARAQATVSAAFGEAADAATGVSTGSTVSLGLSHVAGARGASLLLGVPADPEEGTRWASGAVWGEWPTAVRVAGLTATGHGFAYHDPVLESDGAALDVRAQLFRDLAAGPVTLRIRGGGRGGVLGAGGATVRRLVWGAGSDATVSAGAAVARLSADLWAAPEGVYPAVAASAAAAWRGLVAHGRVEKWLDEALSETGWSVGAELEVLPGLSLVAHVARPAIDILFFSPSQRSWSVGLRYGIGGEPAAVPTSVFTEANDRVRLEAAADGSGPVRVAGTFSDWQPLDMRREDGRWVIDLRLETGVHEYTFIDAAGDWFVPEDAPGRKPDGFGGFVATVVVR